MKSQRSKLIYCACVMLIFCSTSVRADLLPLNGVGFTPGVIFSSPQGLIVQACDRLGPFIGRMIADDQPLSDVIRIPGRCPTQGGVEGLTRGTPFFVGERLAIPLADGVGTYVGSSYNFSAYSGQASSPSFVAPLMPYGDKHLVRIFGDSLNANSDTVLVVDVLTGLVERLKTSLENGESCEFQYKGTNFPVSDGASVVGLYGTCTLPRQEDDVVAGPSERHFFAVYSDQRVELLPYGDSCEFLAGRQDDLYISCSGEVSFTVDIFKYSDGRSELIQTVPRSGDNIGRARPGNAILNESGLFFTLQAGIATDTNANLDRIEVWKINPNESVLRISTQPSPFARIFNNVPGVFVLHSEPFDFRSEPYVLFHEVSTGITNVNTDIGSGPVNAALSMTGVPDTDLIVFSFGDRNNQVAASVGTEPWVYSLSENKASLLKDLNEFGSSNPDAFVAHADAVYFWASTERGIDDQGTLAPFIPRLFVTKGSPDSTVEVLPAGKYRTSTDPNTPPSGGLDVQPSSGGGGLSQFFVLMLAFAALARMPFVVSPFLKRFSSHCELAKRLMPPRGSRPSFRSPSLPSYQLRRSK